MPNKAKRPPRKSILHWKQWGETAAEKIYATVVRHPQTIEMGILLAAVLVGAVIAVTALDITAAEREIPTESTTPRLNVVQIDALLTALEERQRSYVSPPPIPDAVFEQPTRKEKSPRETLSE